MCLITISANSFICYGLYVVNISTKYSIIWKKENNCLLAHALVNARELGGTLAGC